MAMKLKNAADRCKLLEREDRVEQTDLEKAVSDAKDARSAMRAMKEELLRPERSRLESPLCCGGSSVILNMLC